MRAVFQVLGSPLTVVLVVLVYFQPIDWNKHVKLSLFLYLPYRKITILRIFGFYHRIYR